MTALPVPPCRCGHVKAEHDREGFAPQCISMHCECIAYRPAVAGGVQHAHQGVQQPRPPVVPVVTAPPTVPRPAEPDIAVRGERGPSIESLLQAGKRSEYKRTVTLTEKIAELIHDLRSRLTDEREASEEKRQADLVREEARRKIAALEAQLQEARSQLSGKLTRPKLGNVVHVSRAGSGDQSCPDCGKGGLVNVGAHRMRAHGWRRGDAS